MPSDFTGYKIEIKNTAKPLSASNDIFFQHGKLYAEKMEDGSISYLLGDFDNAEAAGSFMSDFLARRYPDAKVIEYNNGNRRN